MLHAMAPLLQVRGLLVAHDLLSQRLRGALRAVVMSAGWLCLLCTITQTKM